MFITLFNNILFEILSNKIKTQVFVPFIVLHGIWMNHSEIQMPKTLNYLCALYMMENKTQ